MQFQHDSMECFRLNLKPAASIKHEEKGKHIKSLGKLSTIFFPFCCTKLFRHEKSLQQNAFMVINQPEDEFFLLRKTFSQI